MIPADSMARPRQNVQRTTLHSSTWSARRGLSTRTNRDGRARGGLGEEQARPCRTANSTHSHQPETTRRLTSMETYTTPYSSTRTGHGLTQRVSETHWEPASWGVAEMVPTERARWDTFPTAQWTHTGPLDDSQAQLTWLVFNTRTNQIYLQRKAG